MGENKSRVETKTEEYEDIVPETNFGWGDADWGYDYERERLYHKIGEDIRNLAGRIISGIRDRTSTLYYMLNVSKLKDFR